MYRNIMIAESFPTIHCLIDWRLNLGCAKVAFCSSSYSYLPSIGQWEKPQQTVMVVSNGTCFPISRNLSLFHPTTPINRRKSTTCTAICQAYHTTRFTSSNVNGDDICIIDKFTYLDLISSDNCSRENIDASHMVHSARYALPESQVGLQIGPSLCWWFIHTDMRRVEPFHNIYIKKICSIY